MVPLVLNPGMSDVHLAWIEKLGWPCQIPKCDAPAKIVRNRAEPIWGLAEDEIVFLAEFRKAAQSLSPDQLTKRYGARCDGHEQWRKFGDKWEDLNVRLAVNKKTETIGRHKRTKQLKEAAIKAYGGKCLDCGQTHHTQLILCLAPEFENAAESVWKAQGVDTWGQKWEWLEEHDYPEELCVVRCFACRGENDSTKRKPPKRNLRLRMIHEYGGRCISCGSTDQNVLWLVRAPGQQILRHGESGRKLTSKQKYEKLLREGCPKTHVLLCPDCWSSSRVGSGSGYLTEDER